MGTKKSLLPLMLLLFLWTSLPSQAEAPWIWTTQRIKAGQAACLFDWTLPSLAQTPGDTSAWQKLLNDHVTQWRRNFQTDYDAQEAEFIKISQRDPSFKPAPWESSGSFQVVWTDPRYLVVLWQGYDFRGGAHGMPVLDVCILDRDNPDRLQSSRLLFSFSTEALDTLSRLCRQQLAQRFAEDSDADTSSSSANQASEPDEWVIQGTQPQWSNFSIVYPTNLNGPDRFEVIFPPYQVAPYAMGSPTVTIPWKQLSPFTPSLTQSQETGSEN